MDRLSQRTAPGPRRPSEYRPLIMNRSRSESTLSGEAGGYSYGGPLRLEAGRIAPKEFPVFACSGMLSLSQEREGERNG